MIPVRDYMSRMRWVTLGLLLSLTTTARAADEPGVIALDALSVHAREPELQVAFRVAPTSWQWINEHKLQPVLVLDVRFPGGRSERREVALIAADTRSVVKLANYRTVDSVDVSLDARARQPVVLALGDTQVQSVRVRVHREAAR